MKYTLVLSSVFAFFMFGLYVFQVNSLTMLAYMAQNAETQLKTTAQEATVLEAVHQQAFAFQQLGTLAKNLNFEKTGIITYVHILQGAVARTTQNQQ